MTPKPPATPKLAAALQYRATTDAAPRVTASGRGALAERILALAAEHDIPIREDGALVQLLLQVPVGDTIPLELYDIVAELLAAIYRAEQIARETPR